MSLKSKHDWLTEWVSDKVTYWAALKSFVVLKVKNGGQRLFLGVQSVHPRLTTARIKGKPLLEKNVSTKAKTKTKTSKNTKTKTWTQTKTKTDKKSTRQHHPDLREAPILKNTLQGLIYTERQFCQMETCLKGCSTATTSLDESLPVRVIQCFLDALASLDLKLSVSE